MSGPARPPGMNDVARLAGVSHQTVSRVLNGHPSVRPETRARVRAAIAELGYRRNSAARALVTRRTRTIGVLTRGSALHGPASTLIGLEGAARDAGYYVSVAAFRELSAEAMHDAIEHFLGQGVDGIAIIAPQRELVRAASTFPSDVPRVLISSVPEEHAHGLATVSVDQRTGARWATEHLLALGPDTVVHLAGPEDWFDAEQRVLGWREACAAAGVAVEEPQSWGWEASAGYEAGRRMAREGVPRAVFAANDQLALGLLRAFVEAGVSVPGDTAVVGFDDEVGAGYFVPPLTTVRQDFDALGREAIRVLAAEMAGAPVASAHIPAELVVRASTTPAPGWPGWVGGPA